MTPTARTASFSSTIEGLSHCSNQPQLNKTKTENALISSTGHPRIERT
jgi:hypothetical protein